MSQRIAFLSAVLASLAVAQTPPGPNGRLISVDVVVTNGADAVKGLTKDSFILEDKGKKQTISVFDITDDSKVAPAAQLPPGLGANRLNSKGQPQGNATVVLYDKINSDPSNQAFVRGQVLTMLAGLTAKDRVGFYSLGFNLARVHDFDEDVSGLARVAAALLKSGTVPDAFSAEDKDLFKKLADAVSPMQALQNQARVDITYPAFRSLARHLGGIPGRKNLLWITSYFPLTYGNSVDRRSNDQQEVDAFKTNLTESNIALFPVDPGGTGASFNTSSGAPVSTEGSLLAGTMRNSAGTSASVNVDTSLTGNQAMQLFAAATGGKAFRNANDITPALREVIASTGYTYTLGFIADEKALDGRVHNIKVGLVKNPATDKATLSHRHEYFAWNAKTPPGVHQPTSLQEVLADPLEATGIGLLAVSNPSSDPAKMGYQQVEMRVSGADLHFEPKANQFHFAFDMAVTVEGQNGGAAETFAKDLTPEQVAGVIANGLDVGKALNTQGAGGVFRIAVQDKVTGAVGSVRVPFHK